MITKVLSVVAILIGAVLVLSSGLPLWLFLTILVAVALAFVFSRI